jgi:presenilin-like A22 family membrane protease
MKHTAFITIALIALFFIAQGVGLFTVNKYINVETDSDGVVTIIHEDTVVGPQPDIPPEERSFTFIIITIMILIGTGFLFLLIKFKLGRIWKFWFFFAIAMTLSISFDVYMPELYAIGIAVILAIIRLWKPNVIVHNFSEIFIYTGIAILLLPLLNLFSGILLLVAISIYDMIAVWKSKHMITLAKFQIESKSFAGLSMSYTPKKKISLPSHAPGKKAIKPKKPSGRKKKESDESEKPRNAILGGGDIAFPLLFAAAVMEHLIIVNGIPKLEALLLSFLVSIGAGIALTFLLLFSKQEKFYPAMPFISSGCIVGYLAIFLLI